MKISHLIALVTLWIATLGIFLQAINISIKQGEVLSKLDDIILITNYNREAIKDTHHDLNNLMDRK